MIGSPPFSKDGYLYVGRSENFQGAHALGVNDRSIGICLVGNFDAISPSDAQLETLFSLLLLKTRAHNIPSARVLGHRELEGVTKSCPGKKINMDLLRAELERRAELVFRDR